MKLEEFIGEGYKAPNKIYAGRLSVTFNDATNKEVEMFKELETVSFGAETGVGITIEAIGCTNSGGYEKDPLEKLGYVRRGKRSYKLYRKGAPSKEITFLLVESGKFGYVMASNLTQALVTTEEEAKALLEILERPEYYDLI